MDQWVVGSMNRFRDLNHQPHIELHCFFWSNVTKNIVLAPCLCLPLSPSGEHTHTHKLQNNVYSLFPPPYDVKGAQSERKKHLKSPVPWVRQCFLLRAWRVVNNLVSKFKLPSWADRLMERWGGALGAARGDFKNLFHSFYYMLSYCVHFYRPEQVLLLWTCRVVIRSVWIVLVLNQHHKVQFSFYICLNVSFLKSGL